MDPKLKVFLSSEQHEPVFTAERQTLSILFSKQPLLSMFVLWKMESTASPMPPEQQYRFQVQDSDLLILLLERNLRKAVKEEYNEARGHKKPIFAFLKKCAGRSREMSDFIDQELKRNVTYVNYSDLQDLCEKVENSLLSYFFSQHKEKNISVTSSLIMPVPTSQEERALRILVGVLDTEVAARTREECVNALVIQSLLDANRDLTVNDFLGYCTKLLHQSGNALQKELEECISRLLADNRVVKGRDNAIRLSDGEKARIKKILENNIAQEDNVLLSLHKKQSGQLHGIDFRTYSEILPRIVAHIVYECAASGVETGIRGDFRPVGLDADELNRIVSKILANEPNLPSGVARWQPVIIEVLMTNEQNVVSWINRLHKAYWMLATLDMDPSCAYYKKEHLKKYCVYFDSHVVLRAMVKTGDDAQMYTDIIELGREAGIEMRLSEQMFEEIQSAFYSANKVFIAAGKDALRALQFYENVGRRCDILSGYLNMQSSSSGLSWERYLNRFYSPADPTKLRNFIEKEVGVCTAATGEFSVQQLERIEEITGQLLKSRRRLPEARADMSEEQKREWERQHTLRAHEARQMAIIYEARSVTNTLANQYWFVTMDKFVYEVSVSLGVLPSVKTVFSLS